MSRSLIKTPRSLLVLLHDVVMAALSFVIALGLRVGWEVWQTLTLPEIQVSLILFTLVCAAVFGLTGLYRGIWRYASLQDLAAIVRAVTLALLIFLPILFLVTRLEAVPRSFLVIDWFVLIFLLGAPRMAYRVLKDRGVRHLLERTTSHRVPVLLVGAGDEAELFIRDQHRDPSGAYEVVAIVDERGRRVGRRMHDVPVMGDLARLDDVIVSLRRRNRAPQRLIVTRPIDRAQIERLLEAAETYGMTLARLPRLTEFKAGTEPGAEKRLEVKPLAVEDLLSRPQANLDRAAMAGLIEGRTVLVTGAGGSIGAELARQAAEFQPARLILLDHSEYLLYNIDLELGERWPELARRAILQDVRDLGALDRIFGEERPELVLHAAAIKHVPLAEANPAGAVTTNVLGTRNVAEACRAHAVRTMVQVSTDKAINPTGVMGATKRLAESYCQALDIAERRNQGGGDVTRFVTVRFGNVLGSTGSVVPLFQRQLARGGPLTVTHRDMTRYFMTIREAVQLVLQASALGLAGSQRQEVGRIYVLDMGEPIRISDLARQVIRLAGYRPDKDVGIVYTGMRPGEKLHEQLFHPGEPMVATSHPSLRLAEARTVDLNVLRQGLDQLAEQAESGRIEDMIATLERLVPEYRGAGRDESVAAAS